MLTEQTGQNVIDDGQQSGGNHANDGGQQSNKTPESMPYHVFQEENKAKKAAIQRAEEAENKLKEIADGQTEAQRQKLAEDGEFKQLNETLSTENTQLKDRVSALEKTEVEMKELKDTMKADILARLPEEMREGLKNESLSTLQVVLNTIPKDQQKRTDVSDPANSRTHKGGYGPNGEFKSKVDWVAADPEGYEKARAAERNRTTVQGYAGTITHMSDKGQ